ncbi:serine-rich protein-related [Abeliophyllum distichum]|uniref:Serine-rich protein-related n=1 Tax=Abeliophyllum distichum TaxID=126358 RepID=A0ABD1PNY6_9LAMI
MAAYSARRSSGPVIRSLSPSGRLNRHYSSQASHTPPLSRSSFASSSSSTFATSRSFQRTTPSTPVNLHKYMAPSMQFTLDRPSSPNRPMSVTKSVAAAARKRACMCSPTTHPGSFRCSLHRGFGINNSRNAKTVSGGSSNRFNWQLSAMTKCLVRIGIVEGDIVKRALQAALIRPSSHQQRRRSDFQPRRPSRLSVMSNA